MKKNEFLDLVLTGLARLEVELDSQGGPPANCDFFEDILYLQEEVLRRFGLPLSPTYRELVSFETIPSEEEIADRIQLLHVEAAKYLLGPTKSELQTLQEALKLQLPSPSVLAELNVSSHIYTHFVYDKILLKGKDSPENVLQEFRILEENDILDTLGKWGLGTLENEQEDVSKLKGLGLKYLSQYSIHNSNLLSDDDY